MLFPHSLSIENYRSLRERVSIPFSRKVTFVVGPNNSGKSNILRILGILFNNSHNRIDKENDFDGPDKRIHLAISLSREALKSKLANVQGALSSLERTNSKKIDIDFDLDASNGIAMKENKIIEEIFGAYSRTSQFLHDFGQSGNNNLNILLQNIRISDYFNGTTYVPNIRFITNINQEPSQFVSWDMPGETVAFGSVISRLASMDRPDLEHRYLRDHKRQLEEFMAYCLEKRSVQLEIPESKKTILVNIDGDERSISAFGTGVEQLVMIGVASLGFSKKLVLIDEPECHLHPRAQRRIINYLDANVDAQFVIATHSAAILDSAEADIIQVTNDGTGTKSRTIQRNRERYEAVRDLGHSASELIQTKFAIWVEGPSDRIYIASWIARIDPNLVEGIDYTILFYGGKILSHHSFLDQDSDLIRAVSLSRSFAVVMDSDRKLGRPNINKTKSRVRDEIEREGGLCWITDGREIENYVPVDVMRLVSTMMKGISIPADKRDQVLDPENASKVEFARLATSKDNGEWPLDLKPKMSELVEHIRRAQ